MTEGDSTAEFLGMGIDLSTDTFTGEEKEQALRWYRQHHDHGELDVVMETAFDAVSEVLDGSDV